VTKRSLQLAAIQHQNNRAESTQFADPLGTADPRLRNAVLHDICITFSVVGYNFRKVVCPCQCSSGCNLFLDQIHLIIEGR
jgi:hypothetical protein